MHWTLQSCQQVELLQKRIEPLTLCSTGNTAQYWERLQYAISVFYVVTCMNKKYLLIQCSSLFALGLLNVDPQQEVDCADIKNERDY